MFCQHRQHPAAVACEERLYPQASEDHTSLRCLESLQYTLFRYNKNYLYTSKFASVDTLRRYKSPISQLPQRLSPLSLLGHRGDWWWEFHAVSVQWEARKGIRGRRHGEERGDGGGGEIWMELGVCVQQCPATRHDTELQRFQTRNFLFQAGWGGWFAPAVLVGKNQGRHICLATCTPETRRREKRLYSSHGPKAAAPAASDGVLYTYSTTAVRRRKTSAFEAHKVLDYRVHLPFTPLSPILLISFDLHVAVAVFLAKISPPSQA